MVEHGGMYFTGGFMWIFLIVVLLVVVWAIKAAMGKSSGKLTSLANSKSIKNENATEILKKRYANGEIDD